MSTFFAVATIGFALALLILARRLPNIRRK